MAGERAVDETKRQDGISAKGHLPVLDGLRGVAAVSVVVFHLQELSTGYSTPDSLWARHAYLAVDFFFCLSGYVIGYAYDDRRRIGISGFFKARLIRLHPMVVMGVFLGFLSFQLDPFSGVSKEAPWMEAQNTATWKLIANVVGGALLLPTWGLPNRFGSYMSLNAPSWSLMWEYIANIAYALFLWRLPVRALVALALLAAAGVFALAFRSDTLALGSSWGQMIYAFARMSFSFCAGLLLFRSSLRLKNRFGFGLLSLLLVGLFIMPGFGNPETGKVPLNWLYDVACTIIAFPMIVTLASGAETSRIIRKVCALSGRISYPIYMIHYSVVVLFANYVWTHRIPSASVGAIIGALTGLITAGSFAILVFYDEPVRKIFTYRFLRRASAPGQRIGSHAT